ncbi:MULTISPECIES: class II aldolase/adducin family protein [unclassified Mesorhizobium]|uniref:class II aldolase/adducin family protein n=1 Tax=unclassified Mesorhizobium TaxID=325217 RepID=UPI000FC9DF4A|nr:MULTISPECIES: class II aldolase/adducin family protein [unclassified Mesorhizobium]TGP21491.1 hypothetical protein EN874_024465 [Mesorhizobium sp. M1D.F.Ca.ET.231.01.1.1]TGP28937.1 hypothetical protein EN877_22845 [Mesorhizobium sp. M1D.F.Ca.ET.234.01.1.1]TGS43406.1 hypothetical protein EN827_22840 [Mesorhizobium sp. M1D.F.Ca.ET.184.01.1.1]TGS59953.1 hypothetical protein EN826_022840 [Mesorhizobium sp. M1D.F.Ca.ET.183.01.1.1]
MAKTAARQRPTALHEGEWERRVDLAAAFRLAAINDWHEAVGNHFSLAVSVDGKRFLMNPRWKHFSAVRASDLLLLDSDDPSTMDRPDAPDVTAWCIHGRLHALAPQARCVLHLHPVYATVMASLANPEIKPIDQNTARFFNRVAIDLGYQGLANSEAEGERLASVLGNRSVLMMGNHGVLVAAETVAEAFDCMYYLERACQTMVLALSTGQPLSVLSDNVAEKTAMEWQEGVRDYAIAHFDEMKRRLDVLDPDYAN